MSHEKDEFDFDDDEMEAEFLKLDSVAAKTVSSSGPSVKSFSPSVEAQSSFHGQHSRSEVYESTDNSRDNKNDDETNGIINTSINENTPSPSSPSYSPKSQESNFDLEFEELEKSCYFNKASQNDRISNVSRLAEEEVLENKKDPPISEPPLKSPKITANFNVSGEFNDSDDELFSQVNLSPQVVEIHKTSVIEELNSTHQEDEESNGNERIDQQLMGPPSTPVSKKRHIMTNSTKINSPLETTFKQPRTSGGDLECLEEFERFIGQNSDSVYHLKRRFPGPAGLLPNIDDNELKHLNHSPHPLSQKFSRIIAEDSVVHEKEVVALQGILPRLEPRSEKQQLCLRKAPWREILRQLNLNINDKKCPIHFMNIKWIRTKAIKLNTFLKIPFLVAILQEAPEIIVSRGKASLKNPSVKLIDSTGCIIAALDAAIITSLGVNLSPGTALALRNVGLIRFKRQVILTITKKNLICITSHTTEDPVDITDSTDNNNEDEYVPEISYAGDVKIMKFGEFNSDLVLSEYKEITSVTAQSLDEMFGCDEVDTNESSVGLFTNISNLPNYSNYSRGSDKPINITSTKLDAVQTVMEVNSSALVDDMSAFDDNDDELFQAIDLIDFGNGNF